MADTKSISLCCIDGCTNKAQTRDYCKRHFKDAPRVRLPAGSRQVSDQGYIRVPVNGVRRLEHVLIVEQALGGPLPPKAEIHHVNEIRHDNRPCNLVVCPDRAYHMLLHARQRAMDECGNPNWRKCHICRQYDDPANLSSVKTKWPSDRFFHAACNVKNVAKYRAKKRAKLGLPA